MSIQDLLNQAVDTKNDLIDQLRIIEEVLENIPAEQWEYYSREEIFKARRATQKAIELVR